jgi:ADP-ribosylglycohydrolase
LQQPKQPTNKKGYKSMIKNIQGGLFGQALGDAWAMPALMTPEDTWAMYGGWITRFLPAPDSHPFHHGLPAGKITDDTEQAASLAEAIIVDGKVTVEGAARAVLSWYERVGGDACPYVGPSTRRAVHAIKAGADLQSSGRFGDTNGASMRVSPVGLIHPGQVRAAAEDACVSCVPTHNTNVAMSGAAAVAGAIAAAMVPGASLDDVVAAGKQAAEVGRSFADNHWIGASVARRIDQAVQIARSGKPPLACIQELYDVVGATLAITESVPAAFGVLVLADGDPVQAAIYGAALSGDADTVSAMACAMAGAWKGIDAFPPEVVDTLRAANPEIDFDRLAFGLEAVAKKNLAAS